jgi:dUTP pyrophosphatase
MEESFTNNIHHHYSLLKLYVNKENKELIELYREAIQKHNSQTMSNPYYNSGFDLFIPEDVRFIVPIESNMINLQVKGEMFNCVKKQEGLVKTPSPYYLYPRSSISKSPFMLANHTGIIDAGYRGNLIAAVRWLKAIPNNDTPVHQLSENICDSSPDNCVVMNKHSRYFQICQPALLPIYVVLIDNENELSTTERGEGGFGSTGK